MDKYLVTKIQNYLLKNGSDHEKKSFWASDAEKPVFDLYHAWIGTPVTNPIEAEKLLMMKTGKADELTVVKMLKEMGELKDIGEDQERIEIKRYEIPITGYMDGVFKNGMPLEVKSFYGDYQTRELEKGKPKTSYLKQLAIYMDATDADKGKLLYRHRGTGQMFEFTLVRQHGLVFKCMTIEFDLMDTYKRWARLYNNNIVPRIEPKSEYRYKIPIDEINWKKLSKSDITKARNNRKVIGDHPYWIQYSSYKDLILEREGVKLGYSDEELAKIKELTKGYSKW